METPNLRKVHLEVDGIAELSLPQFTAENVEAIQQRETEIERLSEQDEAIDLLMAEYSFIDDIVMRKLFPWSYLGVSGLSLDDQGNILGIATGDSKIVWYDSLNEIHPFTLRDTIVEIRQGLGNWAEMSVQRYNDGPSRLKVTLEIDDRGFGLATGIVQAASAKATRTGKTGAELGFEILNYEYQSGKFGAPVLDIEARVDRDSKPSIIDLE